MELQGTRNGAGCRFAVVVSRFNEEVTSGLLAGARQALKESSVGEDDVTYNVNEKILIELPIEVSAIVRVEVANGWRLRERVLGDIKRAIETSDRKFANGTTPETYLLTAEFRRESTKSLRREAGASVMGSSVTYRVTYGEPWGGHLLVTP